MCGNYYQIKPKFEVKGEITLTLARNEICLIHYRKGRLLCKQLDNFDQLVLGRLLITNFRDIVNRYTYHKLEEIKKLRQKVEKIKEELQKPKIYRYYNEAVGEIEYKLREIENLEEKIMKLLEEFKDIERYKEWLDEAISKITRVQEDLDIKIDNDFYLM